LAAAAEKITAAEKLWLATIRQQKIIPPLPEFCPAIEFDTVKFGRKAQL